jgi:hypothetical protein
MISDTRIECRNANSQGETTELGPTGSHRGGVEPEAGVRLAWMDFYRRGRNVARTCRHFGISRQTFYRWQRRYDPYDLTTLEERSHCPRRRRQPTWSFPLEDRF